MPNREKQNCGEAIFVITATVGRTDDRNRMIVCCSPDRSTDNGQSHTTSANHFNFWTNLVHKFTQATFQLCGGGPYTGLGQKVGPRLSDCCRQGHAEVISKSRNWGPPFSRDLYRARPKVLFLALPGCSLANSHKRLLADLCK